MKLEYIITLVVAVAILVVVAVVAKSNPAAVASKENSIQSSTLSSVQKAAQFKQYTEIANPSGFLNTDGKAITIGQYVGKEVILVDFLTYSCINCQRTFPYLTKWYDTYHDKGLEIIAIHTPEFAFEHDPKNVQKALDGFGIHFPVVLDNDYATWNAYGNQYWPRKYLIDIDGYVVYDHIGEGSYDETEQKIVDLLNERAQRLNLPAVTLGDVSNTVASTLPSLDISPETYVGTDRGDTPANPAVQCTDGVCMYDEPSEVPSDRYDFGGSWKRAGEYAESQQAGDSISYTFRAKTVHLVASADTAVTAQVLLDGKPISPSVAGSDVTNGNVSISDARLYNLVSLPQAQMHTIELRFNSAGAKIFTLTFG